MCVCVCVLPIKMYGIFCAVTLGQGSLMTLPTYLNSHWLLIPALDVAIALHPTRGMRVASCFISMHSLMNVSHKWWWGQPRLAGLLLCCYQLCSSQEAPRMWLLLTGSGVVHARYSWNFSLAFSKGSLLEWGGENVDCFDTFKVWLSLRLVGYEASSHQSSFKVMLMACIVFTWYYLHMYANVSCIQVQWIMHPWHPCFQDCQITFTYSSSGTCTVPWSPKTCTQVYWIAVADNGDGKNLILTKVNFNYISLLRCKASFSAA